VSCLHDEDSPRLCCGMPFPGAFFFWGDELLCDALQSPRTLLGLGKGKESVAETRYHILSRNFYLVPLANLRSGFVSSVHLELSALS